MVPRNLHRRQPVVHFANKAFAFQPPGPYNRPMDSGTIELSETENTRA